MVSTGTCYPLSPLDHLPPPNYTYTAIYLSLKPGINPTEAFEILHKGLHATSVQLPWLGGKIWPQPTDTPGWRPGQLELRHDPVHIDGPWPSKLRYKELSSSISYDDLKEAAFPTDSFEDEDLIWAPFLPNTSDGCDVFVAQANFLPGGCVVIAALNHAAGDGLASFMTINLWADHCKALQSKTAPPTAPPAECSDRSLQEQIWAKEGTGKTADEIDLDVWRLCGVDPSSVRRVEISNGHAMVPTGNFEHAKPRPLKSSIFYMSPSQFTALQKECVNELGTASQVSGAHAISGLIWRSLVRIRSLAATKHSYEQPVGENGITYFDMLIDGRSGFSQSLPQGYIGNQTMMVQSSMPLSTLTSPTTSIATVAGVVRENASRVDTGSLLDSYTHLKQLPNYDELQVQWQGRQMQVARSGMMITSMLMAPIAKVNFGDAVFGNGGKPDSARPLMGSFNQAGIRICFVLPKTKAGGVEFVVNLFEEEMDLLVEDEEFARFAMFLA